MKASGHLSKMVVQATTPVSYALSLGDAKIPLNPFLGKVITLQFQQKIHCVYCQREIKKPFQDGYCFPCSQKLARCDLCIVKPERCHFHLGTCREPEWGLSHCMIPHIVYLSNASGIKVGITRVSHIPTRWIDQGAIQAIPFFEVSSRRVSGFVEVAIGKIISDKTNWRKMLSQHQPIDLLAYRKEIGDQIQKDLEPIYQQFGFDAIKKIENSTLHQFAYPVLEYPTKITSLSFDKNSEITGKLMGIKGQYIILDCGVINIRKHSGYFVQFFSSNHLK